MCDFLSWLFCEPGNIGLLAGWAGIMAGAWSIHVIWDAAESFLDQDEADL